MNSFSNLKTLSELILNHLFIIILYGYTIQILWTLSKKLNLVKNLIEPKATKNRTQKMCLFVLNINYNSGCMKQIQKVIPHENNTTRIVPSFSYMDNFKTIYVEDLTRKFCSDKIRVMVNLTFVIHCRINGCFAVFNTSIEMQKYLVLSIGVIISL